MSTQQYNIEKRRKGRKKITEKRCLDILTFDIETTSYWIKPDGSITGYVPGKSADYWNSLVRGSLPYIWQFSFNDKVYYGREIRDFLNVLDDLPKGVKFIIWVHNLGFEFAAALLNILTIDRLFARTPHSPMYAIFKEYPDVEFRCSYVLTNMSLDTWGKQLGVLKKTGDLDYHQLRTPFTKLTRKELGYCERDCIVVYEGIKDHLKIYKDVWDIPMTSTGRVRRPFKDLVTHDKAYMKHMKKLVPKDIAEYERWRKVFAGGYTHCNRKYLNTTVEGPIYHVDIASSYPFILVAYRFPYGRWGFLGNVLPDESKFDDRAYICKLHFKGVKVKTWNTYISASKCVDGRRIISDNGRVLLADELTVWVTEFDYTTIMATYDFEDIQSLGCWCCHKQYLPAIYIDFVLQQYEGKTSLKGVDPVQYYISKTRLNALYGMAVSNIVQSDVIFDPDRGWYVEPLTADKVNYKFDKMRRWFDRSYFLHYASGCWVTAAARFRLWECIRRIDSDLVYTDTDSLFYLNEHDWGWFNDDATQRLRESCSARGIDFERTRPKDPKGKPHPLGVLEPEETADRFRSLGAKKYVEERGGKLYMTVSGVNKAAVSALDSIDDFQDGFVFDKDFKDMHKNEICYLDDMKPVTFPDGYYCDLKYGVNMRPTGYELSVPTVYDNIEKTLRALEFPTDEMIQRKRGIIVDG